MLFAVLFDENDRLIAAAPAVFQYSAGDSFWQQVYAGDVPWNSNCQTAYVQVNDDETVALLNTLELDDTHLPVCRERIESIMGLTSIDANHRPPRAA